VICPVIMSISLPLLRRSSPVPICIAIAPMAQWHGKSDQRC